MHPSEYKLNWRPGLPDPRDVRAKLKLRLTAAPPPSTDLRPHCPLVYDQGNLGSCVWNATGAAVQYDMMKQGSKVFVGTPSRLFGYFNTRVDEGDAQQDDGCTIRDAMRSLNSLGVCAESLWPYVESRFARRPPKVAYRAALKEKSVLYTRVDNTNLTEIKQVLAGGYPIVFGFTVWDSFLSDDVAKTGVVPMPDTATEQVQGGHAMLLVGYSDEVDRFICRNSWGVGWGIGGYCTMMYSYLDTLDLAGDFWTVTLVN